MGELPGGVVGLSGDAPVGVPLLDQAVHRVEAEGGPLALGVDQGGQPPLTVVRVGEASPVGVDQGAAAAQQVVE
jgi:hypothetical protein